jgi:CheY-like chemotaxis protein
LNGKTPDCLNAEKDSEKIQNDIYWTMNRGGSWIGELQNRKKDGTLFSIELSENEQIDKNAGTLNRLVGSEPVLLMDDEETIRSMAQLSLGKLGYRVTTVADGEKAIALYKKAMDSAEKFEVVIMDLTVPSGMGAVDTVRKLLEIDPEARAIVSSGYHDNEVVAQYDKYGFKASVPKPYDLIMLGRILREVLRK